MDWKTETLRMLAPYETPWGWYLPGVDVHVRLLRGLFQSDRRGGWHFESSATVRAMVAEEERFRSEVMEEAV